METLVSDSILLVIRMCSPRPIINRSSITQARCNCLHHTRTFLCMRCGAATSAPRRAELRCSSRAKTALRQFPLPSLFESQSGEPFFQVWGPWTITICST
jgi:hypothetical protein